jgi:lipoprotein-releasing system ATP-binding protein
MANTPVLELRGIHKKFGDLRILRGVDLTLSAGESTAILGPSGAGKSTLLHIAGLMERPSEGELRVAGRDARRMSERELARERLDTIGFLFQFHHLLPDFNVLENVLMPARLAGDELALAERRAKEILERLGLSERLHHRPHELSGGEQQRTGLARALIRRPKLLLCDEPTGNLDSVTAHEVAELIWTEVKREGVAAIIVTHNERLASQAGSAQHLAEGRFESANKGVGV